MVKLPVAYTLATVLPLTVPYSALASTAILAAPPRAHPAAQTANSIRKSPTPAFIITPAKRM
jgi:hypothetical protein